MRTKIVQETDRPQTDCFIIASDFSLQSQGRLSLRPQHGLLPGGKIEPVQASRGFFKPTTTSKRWLIPFALYGEYLFSAAMCIVAEVDGDRKAKPVESHVDFQTLDLEPCGNKLHRHLM